VSDDATPRFLEIPRGHGHPHNPTAAILVDPGIRRELLETDFSLDGHVFGNAKMVKILESGGIHVLGDGIEEAFRRAVHQLHQLFACSPDSLAGVQDLSACARISVDLSRPGAREKWIGIGRE
jgi:hypothetical protein